MENLLTIDRNEIFELAYRFVTETSENIFLTGKAGTGKTTFLKYLKVNCSKNIVVAAPTGVAAINAGGITLHSLFQLPFHPFLPTKNHKEELLSKLKFNKQRQHLLRKMELLVIDEISMVRCDTLDAIDTILKSVRRRHDLPFGGVQLLCIGDLYQLPPVAQRQEWNILQEYYNSPFFFDSNVIKEQMPLLIELNTIYRQKEDSFVRLLNKIRNNEMNADDFEDLHKQYNPTFRPDDAENFITLTSHNNQADLINSRELHKIISAPFTYQAIIEGEFAENNYPAEGDLILKEGAQVMFLKNDVIAQRYFNGKIGVVKSLKEDEIIVDCDDIDILIHRETWENSRYVLNREDGKLEQEVIGTFTQFPLRLAWAITIHKSQGLTFEKVMIDAGAAFSSGQVYVALSRCTSLDGIVLLSKIPSAAIYSNGNVIKGHQSLSPKGSLAERFIGARQIFTQQLLEEIFSFTEIVILLNRLESSIKIHREKLNVEAVSWMENFKSNILVDADIGVKFTRHAAQYMRTEPIIEKNEILQERVMAAAQHFIPHFASYQKSLENHPLVTEHREVATVINEHLAELLQAFLVTNYFLKYCEQPFSVTTFLQHKLKWAQTRINISCYASSKKQIESDIPNALLFNSLKYWRDTICNDSSLPIYMVANQNSLKEIATYLPFTKKDLMQISGFGKAKAEKYGDEILELVQEYCHENSLESNMQSKEANPKKERKEKSTEVKTDTKTISFNLFKEGKTIAEIAKERNMATSTIEGHLAPFVADGEIDIDELCSPSKQEKIRQAIKLNENSTPKTLFDYLGGKIGYGDIRLVMADVKRDKL